MPKFSRLSNGLAAMMKVSRSPCAPRVAALRRFTRLCSISSTGADGSTTVMILPFIPQTDCLIKIFTETVKFYFRIFWCSAEKWHLRKPPQTYHAPPDATHPIKQPPEPIRPPFQPTEQSSCNYRFTTNMSVCHQSAAILEEHLN
ncbi:hypothetical protein D3C87_1763900 [compost metagenome]